MGYVTRSAVPNESGARIVHLTKRGHAAYRETADILQDIEREWSKALGLKRFAELKALLGDLWDSPLLRE
jgi:DNA-binding MarR family transcriptional regulator